MSTTTIHAPELRPASQRYATTANGTEIGRSHSRVSREPVAISGPHRAPDTLGDKAVKWASAVGALVVAGLLVLERLS